MDHSDFGVVDTIVGRKTKSAIKPALVEFAAGIANLDTPFTNSEASIVLACGLAGGDHFTVEAGTDGENFTIKFVVENWRRLWYQLTHHTAITPPSMATPIEKLKDVFIEFISEGANKHNLGITGRRGG